MTIEPLRTGRLCRQPHDCSRSIAYRPLEPSARGL